jgi:hypothetical protein
LIDQLAPPCPQLELELQVKLSISCLKELVHLVQNCHSEFFPIPRDAGEELILQPQADVGELAIGSCALIMVPLTNTNESERLETVETLKPIFLEILVDTKVSPPLLVISTSSTKASRQHIP